MAGYAITIIEGNAGRDPELRYTASGKSICQFSVAVSRNWKGGDGEWQEETTWYRVILWGEQGERLAEHLKKGHKVLVQGRIQTRTYKDKSDNDVNTWELVADRAISLEKRERSDDDDRSSRPSGNRPSGNRQQGSSRRPATDQPPTEDLSDLDDLPFS